MPTNPPLTRRKCSCCRSTVVTSQWGREFLCSRCQPKTATVYIVTASRISHTRVQVRNLP